VTLADIDTLPLQQLLSQLPNGSVNVLDRDLRYLFAQGRGLAQVGLSPEALVGRTVWDVFPRERVESVLPHLRRAFLGHEVAFILTLGDAVFAVSAGPLRRERDGGTTAIVLVTQNITQPRGRAEPSTTLTARQREVARLIALGCTNREIGERLVLEPGTVANHVAEILRRLGVNNRTQIAMWATAQGLTDSSDA